AAPAPAGTKFAIPWIAALIGFIFGAFALTLHNVATGPARTTIRIDAATGALFAVYVMIGAFLSFALLLTYKILKAAFSGIRWLSRRFLARPTRSQNPWPTSTGGADNVADAEPTTLDSTDVQVEAREVCAINDDETPTKQDKTTFTLGSVLFWLASVLGFVLFFAFKTLKDATVFCVWHMPCFFLGLLRRRSARPAPAIVDGRHATHIATAASESCTANVDTTTNKQVKSAFTNADTPTNKQAKSATTLGFVRSVFGWMTLVFGTLICIAALTLNFENAGSASTRNNTRIDIATVTTLMAYVLIGSLISFVLLLVYKIVKAVASVIRWVRRCYRRLFRRPSPLPTEIVAEADQDIGDSTRTPNDVEAATAGISTVNDTTTGKKQEKPAITVASVCFWIASLFGSFIIFGGKKLKDAAVFCFWRAPWYFVGFIRPRSPQPNLVAPDDTRPATDDIPDEIAVNPTPTKKDSARKGKNTELRNDNPRNNRKNKKLLVPAPKGAETEVRMGAVIAPGSVGDEFSPKGTVQAVFEHVDRSTASNSCGNGSRFEPENPGIFGNGVLGDFAGVIFALVATYCFARGPSTSYVIVHEGLDPHLVFYAGIAIGALVTAVAGLLAFLFVLKPAMTSWVKSMVITELDAREAFRNYKNDGSGPAPGGFAGAGKASPDTPTTPPRPKPKDSLGTPKRYQQQFDVVPENFLPPAAEQVVIAPQLIESLSPSEVQRVDIDLENFLPAAAVEEVIEVQTKELPAPPKRASKTLGATGTKTRTSRRSLNEKTYDEWELFEDPVPPSPPKSSSNRASRRSLRETKPSYDEAELFLDSPPRKGSPSCSDTKIVEAPPKNGMALDVRHPIPTPKCISRTSDVAPAPSASSSSGVSLVNDNSSIELAENASAAGLDSDEQAEFLGMDIDEPVMQGESSYSSSWFQYNYYYHAHPTHPGPLTAADLPAVLCPPSEQASIDKGIHLSSLSSFRWGNEFSPVNAAPAAPADDRLAVFIGDIPLSALA
ncbi:hypothetical protein HDU96_000996, partial [Phlyctochytrium bullatum]